MIIHTHPLLIRNFYLREPSANNKMPHSAIICSKEEIAKIFKPVKADDPADNDIT
jgi:hypothetical protein